MTLEHEGSAEAALPSPLDERFARGEVGKGLGTTRAIFAALYEADRPLSRDELVDELADRLDAVSLAYVRRVYLHALGSGRQSQGVTDRSVPERDTGRELKRYLTSNLANAVRTGTLAHDGNPDPGARRYRPTDKPPRFKVEPNSRPVPYTREVHAAAVGIEAANVAESVADVDAELWRRQAQTLGTEELEVLLARLALRHAPTSAGYAYRMRVKSFAKRPARSRVAILQELAVELARRYEREANA